MVIAEADEEQPTAHFALNLKGLVFATARHTAKLLGISIDAHV
jgi:hypothetical protein